MCQAPPLRAAALAALGLLAPAALAGGTSTAPSAPSDASARGAPPPAGSATENVLILLADDLGIDGLAAYGFGSDLPSTPTLDGLAADGVLFRNAWSYANCSPTRASLMTGRYGMRTGIGDIVSINPTSLPDTEVTIPEMLDLGTASGWDHAAIGKWHLGLEFGGLSAPNVAGWSHFDGTMTNIQPPESFSAWEQVENGVASQVTGYATTYTVDATLDWISTAQEPWVCYVAFHAPHSPYHQPPANLHSVDFTSGDTTRKRYKAMIEALDTEIGRLLATVDPGVRDRTNVLFLGDNGTPGNVSVPPFDPTHGKGTLYEGGVNVPLIVAGPRVTQPGTESEALVHTVDLFATIADIAGVDLGATLPGVEIDGVSFAPAIADSTLPGTRDVLYTSRFSPNGVGNPPPGPDCSGGPTGPTCQDDLGFGGGSIALSVCGDELYGGAKADVDVVGAPQFAPGFLLVGPTANPVPFLGGTLVPVLSAAFLVQADGNGELHAQFSGGGGAGELVFQFIFVDPMQPSGWDFSNGVRVDVKWHNQRAVRDGRYKLYRNVNTCDEQLYDLDVDPTEQTDLLPGVLTPEEQAAYTALANELDAILL